MLRDGENCQLYVTLACNHMLASLYVLGYGS